MSKELTLRFSRWGEVSEDHFRSISKLINMAVGKDCVLVNNPNKQVDIDISSVYGDRGELDNLYTRVSRKIETLTPGGVQFGPWAKLYNFQPSKNAKVNIFYTAENVRCPYGDWDGYLSFDRDSYGGKNAYFPLWWLTCTDMLSEKSGHFLGERMSLEVMMNSRTPIIKKRKKFCVAFIGMPYPHRLQSLSALASIDRVDVFGKFAGKYTESKLKESKEYKFVFCFENDLYPGYVTEKVFEAWATGAIPLYWGADPDGYINPKAIINLNDFDSIDDFLGFVSKVNKDPDLWESIASQPIIQRAPNLGEALRVLSNALSGL